MPRRESPPRTIEDQVAANFEANLGKVEDRLVAKSGRPPDTRRLSEAEDDHLWALRDTSVDYDQMAERLMTEGLPPEEIQQLAVVQEMPDLAAAYQQATGDAEMAHMLAVFAEYPYRLRLLANMEPGEQVSKAKRLDARMARTSGEPTEETIVPSAGPAAENVYTREPAAAQPAGMSPAQPQQPMAPQMPVVMGG